MKNYMLVVSWAFKGNSTKMPDYLSNSHLKVKQGLVSNLFISFA